MAGQYETRFLRLRDFCQEGVSRIASPLLEATGSNQIGTCGNKFKTAHCCELSNEFLVRVAFPAAEFVVKVSNHEFMLELFSVFKVRQRKKQSRRIRSAGNRDNDGFPLKGQIKPPPFSEQISNEFVHNAAYVPTGLGNAGRFWMRTEQRPVQMSFPLSFVISICQTFRVRPG